MGISGKGERRDERKGSEVKGKGKERGNKKNDTCSPSSLDCWYFSSSSFPSLNAFGQKQGGCSHERLWMIRPPQRGKKPQHFLLFSALARLSLVCALPPEKRKRREWEGSPEEGSCFITRQRYHVTSFFFSLKKVLHQVELSASFFVEV